MAKKNERVCVLFTNPPKGSIYRKNHYAWLDAEKAKEFISGGYGEEYDPKKKSTKSSGSTSDSTKSTKKKDSK